MSAKPKSLTLNLATLVLLLNLGGASAALISRELRCEHAENPLGIDAKRPALSWALEAPGRGERQSAYQILVASSPEGIAAGQGDMWDTGQVRSSQQTGLVYAGKPLANRTKYWWKVRTWDGQGQVGPYSTPATFETAMLEPADWRAKWVGGRFNRIRKDLVIAKPIREARAYVTGLGYFELHINGEKIGHDVLVPGETKYRSSNVVLGENYRALYLTYDISQQLRAGTNAIGLLLGAGFYNQRRSDPVAKAICEIWIRHLDGSTAVFGSDESWKGDTNGPILFNGVYDGEHYDATREDAWNTAGFNDSAWTAV
ncbi:MAG TPA: alpha-L-rhamnosidase N-terminal domain-containing protein, partial [Clostridia bacterium]|nr:alpha-L-rhamnosidase N-terminal domain-containing protein [Clostridia bacterium]